MSGLFDQVVNYSPPLLTAGQVNYDGTWDAATNTPTLVSPPDALSKGDYYVVSVAGTQFGISFAVGDWIISNGTAWEKVDLTDAVSSVFGRTGAVVGVSTDYSAVGITNTAIGASSPSTGAFTTVSASTPIAVASGGTGVTTSTGSGSNVLSTSPTLTTPISASLTSPAASNLTLGTGTFGTALTFTSATGAATFAGRTLVGSATGTLGARFEVNELSDTIAIFVRGAGQTNGVGLGTSGTNQPFVNGYSNVGAVTALGIQPNGGALSIGNSATITTINGTTASTSTTTGSLVNAGGFGNAGAIYAGSTIVSAVSTSGGGVVNFAPANSAAIASGNTANIHFSTYASDANTWQLTARQNSTTPTDKTLRVILGGVAQHTYFNASDLSTQSGIQMKVLDTTTSTSTTTGSLVNAGGFGNAGAAYFGQQVTAARPFMSTGAITANMTSAGGIGFAGGGANVYSFGANAATTGAFSVQLVSSDASLNITPFSLAAGTGAATFLNSVRSTSATGGIGYATGAGGAVTQGTSRTTGVTLNTVAGAITLFTAAGSATWQSFTVTNSAVAATDTIIVNQRSGTDLYMMHVTAVGAGSFRISFATTGGTTSEAPVFNFAVIKAVSS